MGLFANKARPIVSSRLEFARTRADVQARLRCAEFWAWTLCFVAFPLLVVSAVSAVDPAGTRYPWWTAIGLALVFVGPTFGVVVVVPAYLRRLRARTAMRCVHCGAPLLGLDTGSPWLGRDVGNPIARPKEDARGHEVWRTGRCPDCRGRLFEVPPPDVLRR